MFTFVCLFSSSYFFNLSIKWNKLMTTWNQYEKTLLQPPYSNKLPGHRQFVILFCGLMIITITVFDRYFYFLSAVEKTEDVILYCEDRKQDFWKILYVTERQAFFQIISYRSWQIPFLEFYEISKQVHWAFSETFIVIASFTLALRLEQFNKRLKLYIGRHLDTNFWNETRIHYNIVANLVLHADNILSPLFLFYCFCNSFFVCQKIFIQFERGKLPWERCVT
jgi:hypothetical protein